MGYKLNWKPEAEGEFKKFDLSIQNLAFTQFKKLKISPQLGKSLGNKAGLDLTGYRKLYFFKKKYRIVYKLDENIKTVTVFSIAKREGMEVYHRVVKMLESI